MADYFMDSNGRVTKRETKKKNYDYYRNPDGTITKKERDFGDNAWFKKGAFEDGYQFGDMSRSIGNTIGDASLGVLQGVANMGEGIVDLGMYGVAGVSDLVGADSFADDVRNVAKKSAVNDAFEGVRDWAFEDSFLGDKSVGVTQGIGQAATMILTAGAGSAAGLGSAGASALSTGTMFASSAGSGMSEAYESGASDGDALKYGLMKGAVDAGTELLFGGLGKTVNALGISRGISSLDDIFAKKLSSKISNQALRTLTQYGVKSVGEGVEEWLAGLGSAAAKKLTYMSDTDLKQLIKDENLLDQFITGSITSAIMQGGDVIHSASSGRDFVTGMTKNEELVVEKEAKNRIEEREAEGKLSNKEKNAIYDQVKSDLAKGYIGIDTIESVLGGESYKAYKDASDREDALVKEFEELGKKQNATLAEQARYAKLEQQVEELKRSSEKSKLKEQLSQRVSELARSDRLAESYNEKTRRSQAYRADLTKYGEKQQAVVKAAVESGILNNTNRTHEFVDMLAKLSADKGVSFDFTNNQKLRDSGFALEGKTVNGFLKDGSISLNIESAKALNTVVGHEITHVLEGTELYGELQQAVKSFAESKGEYGKRLGALQKLYAGVEGANIENELTADLIGDYLFTDSDFVNRLSTEKPGLFKRIFEEIKYLVKTATAGSKQARELEKVKRAFEKAYRESGKRNAGKETVYSLYVDENIKNKAEQFKKEGYKNFERVKVLDVTPRINEEVKRLVGFDATGYEIYSNTDTYKHIENGHGENGTTDQSMKDMRDVALMPYVLENFDTAELVMKNGKPDVTYAFSDIKGNPSKMIKFTKEIDGEQHVVIATPENKYKKLWVMSEYKKKNEDTSQPSNSNTALPPTSETHSDNVSSTNSIPQSEENASGKQKYSMSDSAGRQISEGQREYFKDSKVRDENGALKPVYHGSGSKFTVFSHDYINTHGSAEGQGFYFTDAEEMAEGYRRNGVDLMQGYLDIKKPLSNEQVTLKKTEVKELLKTLDPTGDLILSDYDSSYGKGYPSKSWYDRALKDTLDTVMSNESDSEILAEISNMNSAEEVLKTVRSLFGYDGYIVENKYDDETVYVAFESNQFKDIHNVNPTYDEDIYMSLSEMDIAPPIGNNVYGKDIALDLPIREDLAQVAEIAPVQQSVPVLEDIGPIRNDVAPAGKTAGEPLKDIGPVRDDIVSQDVPNTEENVPAGQEDSPEELPIETTKNKIAAELRNVKTELANIWKYRKASKDDYEERIAAKQAKYDSKKDKNSKEANALLRQIERLRARSAEIDIGYRKSISKLEAKESKLTERLQRDHTRADKIEKRILEIDKQLEQEKAALEEEYQKKKAEAEDMTRNKSEYISRRAKELYIELAGLSKGKRASSELGYLLDHGYPWSEIRSSLLVVKENPDGTVNPNSASESVIREMLGKEVDRSDDLDAELASKIEALTQKVKKEKSMMTRAKQRMTKQEEYQTTLGELIGDTSTWKDKKMGIYYKVNTLHRNLRDIVRDENGNRDIAKADAIYDELQGKYNHNEAKLNREANEIRGKYAELKITAEEDAYIQMLGEYRHNPDTTLTADVMKEYYEKHKAKIDTEKVDRIIASARQLYDELFRRVNARLEEQGMRPIEYREGYFPHFTDDKQSWLAKLLNWKTRKDEIPTDIAGLTEQFKPVRSWQSFDKHRTGDNTDYSFKKGLDMYVQGALDWIYHIEDIQKRRAFENEIRYRHSDQGVKDKVEAIRNNPEYDASEVQDQIDLVYKEARNPLNNFISDFRTQTNTLAGKKSSMDRGTEEWWNREFYSTMQNISHRVTANMVVGSFSSALTNFIPITQSWAEVSPISSLRAMRDTIKSYIRKDSSVVDNSDFLTNRLRKSKKLYQSTWDKIIDKAGFMMEAVDNFTSQVVWRSKYLENMKTGMSENEAIKNANQFAENVLAGRSRGNNPTIFDAKNPFIKIATAFQLEVNNQYGYLFKDVPQDIKNKAKGNLLKSYAGVFIGAWLYNMAYSALTGRDAALDPIGIIEDLLRDLGFGEDDEEEPADIAANLTESVLEELPFVGGLLGGGRIPISSALPYKDSDGVVDAAKNIAEDVQNLKKGGWKNILKELSNPASYLLLPAGGGQIRKTIQGWKMYDDDLPIAGSYTNSGKLRFAVEDTPLSRLQAALFGQWSGKNAREYIEEGRSPLGEKQIQELVDTGLPMADYWKYRDGLKGKDEVREKIDYIAGLDLPIDTKNILANNVTTRKIPFAEYVADLGLPIASKNIMMNSKGSIEIPIDLTEYDKFSGYEEFDFFSKNKKLYNFLQENGISYWDYKILGEDVQDEYKDLQKDSRKQKFLKDNGVSVSTYCGFSKWEKEAYDWAYKNPEKYQLSQVITKDVVEYKRLMSAINAIPSDKDENGKTIKNSQKKKVTRYINNLNIDYGQKLILFRSLYAPDDTYNYEIVEYLNDREDISRTEMESILNSLGFAVYPDGTVKW